MYYRFLHKNMKLESERLAGAQTYVFPGKKKTGCVLIHGLTGTPDDMKELGIVLSGLGYWVHVPLLTGHGYVGWQELEKAQHSDWLSDIKKSYDFLISYCDTVFFIGFSLGGSLALLSATQMKSAGVVAIATPIKMRIGFMYWLIPLIKRYKPYIKKKESAINDPEARKGRISTPFYPLSSLYETGRLLRNLRKALTSLSVPALLIYSHNDPRVNINNAIIIYNKLKVSNKRLVYVHNSGHVILMDYDKEIAIKEILKFVEANDGHYSDNQNIEA